MLTSLLGIACILAIALLFSTNRRAVRPRVVVTAFALQFAFAVLALRVPQGVSVINGIAGGAEAVLGYSRAGVTLVFGDLSGGPIKNSLIVFVLPIVIFFSSLISILYYLGVMQFVVRTIGGALQRVIGTDRVESLCAAANIFVGQTESPLVIRPYLAAVSPSQMFAIMTSGMAGVAGTILLAYSQLGVRMDFLLAATFMSAPAGLLMAKIVMPETQASAAADRREPVPEIPAEQASSLIMAAGEGAQTGLKIAASIGAMLIAFVSIIALLNGALGAIGSLFGMGDLTFQKLIGYIFAPLMMLLNLSWDEARVAGGLFGEKLILNEFVAYIDFAKIQTRLSAHAQLVITFALCGFANIGSVAIQLAVIGGISPDKRDFVAKNGPRALLAASLANLLNAAVAGLVFLL